MTMSKTVLTFLLTILLCLNVAGVRAATEHEVDLSGQWYGAWIGDFPVGPWASTEFPTGSIFEMFAFPDGAGQYWAVLHVPELGLFDTPLPMIVNAGQVVIGNPPFAQGALSGGALSGLAGVPDPSTPGNVLTIAWQLERETSVSPGPLPPPTGPVLPPLACPHDGEHCSQLLPFAPAIGPGYVDYFVKDETFADQYRSYIRRDLMQLVRYAAAKVEDGTTGWGYGNGAPIGLGDMSRADGSAPTGFPGHNTHEDGNHIDIAYYQRYAFDNLLRPVGRHHEATPGGVFDAFHLNAPPHALDVWRTALFIASLSEHPHLQYILVDGRVGPILEAALVDLSSLGWIEAGAASSVPLIYEQDENGEPYFFHHHDHMHVAMEVLHPIVADARLEPATINRKSRGRHVTGYIELVNGHHVNDIDVSSVALLVGGSTILPAEPGPMRVSDEDGDGIAELVVKFDRQAVTDALEPGIAHVAFIGSANGMAFQAGATVRIR